MNTTTNIDGNSFYVIGLSYKKADVSTRSDFSLSKENQEKLLLETKAKQISGVFVISTCNRTEIIGFAKHPYQLISLLIKYSNGSVEQFEKVSYVYKNNAAIKHFINIATGLDSQIIGDYEIVGQLKESFQFAKKLGTLNAYLERLYNIALQASKEVKNKTSLSSGTTTVSYAAVQFIKDHYENYENLNILIYGIGKIGENTAKSCVKYLHNNNITIINRTDLTAFNLAKELNIHAQNHSNLNDEIIKSDVIIVATGSSNYTLKLNQFSKNKKQLLIDLSLPRNIEINVKNLENKTLIDVDLLSKKTKQTLDNRMKQIPKVEQIVLKHKKEFLEWLHFRKNTPAINTLKNSLENIQKDALFLHTKKHPDLNIDQTEEITSIIINKIVSKFARHLKNENSNADRSIQMMRQIFNAEV